MRAFLVFILLAVFAATAGAQEARVMYVADVAKLADIPGLTGITVDVFWCSGDDEAERRSGIAAEVGAAMAAFARFTDPIATGSKEGQYLRSVRLRPLPKDGSATVPYAAVGRDVALAPSSEGLRSFAETLVRYSGQPIEVAESSEGDMGTYIAVYICGTLSQPDISKRIYLQVATEGQAPAAGMVIAALRGSINGAVISSGVEVLNERSPNNTEIRYFSEEDKAFATQVSGLVDTTIFSSSTPKFIPGYDTEVNRGLVEVWIGTTYEPVQSTTSFVCVGDNEAVCPTSSAWVTCGRDLNEWATVARSCQRSEFTDIGIAVPGGQCGYTVYELRCSTGGEAN